MHVPPRRPHPCRCPHPPPTVWHPLLVLPRRVPSHVRRRDWCRPSHGMGRSRDAAARAGDRRGTLWEARGGAGTLSLRSASGVPRSTSSRRRSARRPATRSRGVQSADRGRRANVRRATSIDRAELMQEASSASCARSSATTPASAHRSGQTPDGGRPAMQQVVAADAAGVLSDRAVRQLPKRARGRLAQANRREPGRRFRRRRAQPRSDRPAHRRRAPAARAGRAIDATRARARASATCLPIRAPRTPTTW